jgi:hypothetical protein
MNSIKGNQSGRGGKRQGAGRKPGSVNKKTREIADRAVEEGMTPLEYMLDILRDKSADDKDRMWAAEKAAPYVHPKLSAIDHSGSLNVSHEAALAELDDGPE